MENLIYLARHRRMIAWSISLRTPIFEHLMVVHFLEPEILVYVVILAEELKSGRLGWYGHVMRRDDNHVSKSQLKWW